MNSEVFELTRDQIAARIEDGAWRRFGVHADEMMRRYRSGALKDYGRVADLLSLAQLLDKDDPLFVPA
jgi:hypothetical protein